MEYFIDYYKILQVSPDSSRENIKKSYRRLTKVYHPDTGNKDDQIMKRINEAYENLSDSEKRYYYDEIYRDHYKPAVENIEIKDTEYPPEVQNNSFAKELTLKDYREKIILAGLVCLFIFIMVVVLRWAIEGMSIVLERNHPGSAPALSLSNAGLINSGSANESSKSFFELESALGKADREKSWTAKACFSLGSNEDEVKAVMGVPQSKSYNTWFYGLSTVVFDHNGKVAGWNEVDQDLKASIGEKDLLAQPFSLGSNKKDVIAAMGTPTGIISDTTWYYSLSSVRFDSEGKVAGWNESNLALQVSLGNKEGSAEPFGKGSTMYDVISAMGTPTCIIYNLWYYGSSSVKFSLDGRVEDWNEVDVVFKAE